MSKLRLTNITLNRARTNFVKSNSVVLWNSENLVLNTDINMSEVFDELVFLEHETTILQTNLRQASAEIGAAIEKNQYNSEFISKHQLQLSESVLRITDINKIAILEIVKLNTFDKIITLYEDEASIEFSKLHTYILSVKNLQLTADILEGIVIESDLTLDLLEKDILNFQSRLDKLEAEIRDIEFMISILIIRINTVMLRAEPALKSLLELRILAGSLQAKFEYLVKQLKFIELKYTLCLLMANQYDERRAYLKGVLLQMRVGVLELEKLFDEMVIRIYELMCKIAILYQKTIDLSAIANEINEYIKTMIRMINNGLLQAGANIAIEYTIEGFAKIHSTLAPYPPRPPRVRKIIKSKPMIFRIPPDPCPPVLPPCPDITPTTTTTTSTEKPTTTTTTTTTKSPDAGGTGEFRINIGWKDKCDVDFRLVDPKDGGYGYFRDRSKGNGNWDIDNVGLINAPKSPHPYQENVFWENSPPLGTYLMDVFRYTDCRPGETRIAVTYKGVTKTLTIPSDFQSWPIKTPYNRKVKIVVNAGDFTIGFA